MERLRVEAGGGDAGQAGPCGYALGQIMSVLNCKLAVLSTPQCGPAPDSNPPHTEFPVNVMVGLERAATVLFPYLVLGYDFKGSSSAEDCKGHLPDRDMTATQWSDPEFIQSTQWFRYWLGGSRKTLAALLLSAIPLESRAYFEGVTTRGQGSSVGTRCVIGISISGGAITRTEQMALPNVIAGTIADLTTRELDLENCNIHWLHFETLNDFLKALQGYGGIDWPRMRQCREPFGLAGQWNEGEYDERYDLLREVPGSTPEERRANLLGPYTQKPKILSKQLKNAIKCNANDRVPELLEQGAPTEGAMEFAIRKFNVAAVEALIMHGVPKDNWLPEAKHYVQELEEAGALDDGDVKERIDALLRALA